MAQYLLSVWHEHEYEHYFSSDDAQRQIAQIGQFNANLEIGGRDDGPPSIPHGSA